MNATDRELWSNVRRAEVAHGIRAAAERKRTCPMPESKTCDGDCSQCPSTTAPIEPPPAPPHREYTSVCPACGAAYLSWHGQDWTCPGCRAEHALGAAENLE